MPERDYYEVLGIPRTAGADQIKQAYRKLAKQYHPDRNPNNREAETQFKEVQAAYDVLGDADKRKSYDQFGHAGVGAGAGPPPGWQTGSGGPGGARTYTWQSGGADIPIEDWEDLFSTFARQRGGAAGRAGGGGIFDEFFGRATRGAPTGGAIAGQDAEQTVTLTFDQAVHGTTLQLSFPQSGGTVSVRIPAGVTAGQRIRVRGKGLPGMKGGPPGDLYIIVNIQPHPYFRRVGNDIYLDLPLTASEAALGARVEIPTLEGKTVLRVPPGTPSGAKLRLKGKGVHPQGKPPGDAYAVVRIVPPRNPTPEQREIFERLRESGEPNPRVGLGWA